MGVRESYSIPKGPGVGVSGGGSIGSGNSSAFLSPVPLTETALILSP